MNLCFLLKFLRIKNDVKSYVEKYSFVPVSYIIFIEFVFEKKSDVILDLKTSTEAASTPALLTESAHRFFAGWTLNSKKYKNKKTGKKSLLILRAC